MGMLIGGQRRLRSALSDPNQDTRERKLRELAQELGCSLASTYELETGKHLEDDVVRRIQAAMREERDSRLWIIAFVSAIASVLSAIAAIAVATKCGQ